MDSRELMIGYNVISGATRMRTCLVGLVGAGKSTALAALWFSVSNDPIPVIGTFRTLIDRGMRLVGRGCVTSG